MNIISLNILDEYAKRLTPNQMNKLYENRCGKKFEKTLNESDNSAYRFYLDAYTIAKETGKSKVNFAMWLNENYAPLMNNIMYKIEKDAIEFKTSNRTLYRKLQESLLDAGISGDTILENRDEKY